MNNETSLAIFENFKIRRHYDETSCHRLKVLASDGKMRETDMANVEVLLRLIQSVPSKKAEPIKLWLAKVGYASLP